MDGKETLSIARKTQSAWVEFVGGDAGAKDLARMLRVPGTKNYKYKPPRSVDLIRDSGEVFNRRELENAMSGSQAPLTIRKGGHRPPISSQKMLMGDERGAYLLSICGYVWKRWAINTNTLQGIAEAINEQQCDPPVNQERLNRIVRAVSKYEQKNSVMTLDLWDQFFDSLGFKFRRNLAGNVLEVNGKPMDDYDRAEVILLSQMAAKQPVGVVERAYLTLGKKTVITRLSINSTA